MIYARNYPYFAIVLFLYMQLVSGQLSTDKNLIWSLRNPNAANDGGLAFIPTDLALVPGRPNSATIKHITVRVGDGSRSTTIHSVAPDFQAGKVYLHAIENGAFAELTISTSSVKILHYGLGYSVQMTVDWSTKNLYWADLFFGWIAVKSIKDTDMFDFKVLVTDIDFPQGIAVDPKRGYLFWTETKGSLRIKRAGLDGESLTVIVIGGVLIPKALTVDIQSGIIYWVDEGKEAIEYCDNNGEQRKVLRKFNGKDIAGIAYYQNMLVTSSKSDNIVIAMASRTGELRNIIPSEAGTPNMIAVYAEENQPYLPDPCASLNCEHFCVATVSAARCLCQDGFTLSEDGRSCSGSVVYGARLLTIASDTHVCFTNVTITQQNVRSELFCPVTDGMKITAISSDSARWAVYYGDRGHRRITRISLKTGQTNTIVTDAGDVEGLDYDWVNDVIYWTDSSTKRIRFRELSGNTGVMLTTNDTLGRITLDPFARKLYWITKSPFSIKSVSYDDPGKVKTLISTGFRAPSDIHCESRRRMLFWTDYNEIKGINTDGTGAQTILSSNENNNMGIVVYQEFMFWTSYASTPYINSGDFYYKVHTHRQRVTGSRTLVDVDILDRFSQQPTRGVCFENGGCDHYCVPTGGSRVCQCELGFQLLPDGKTCGTETLPGKHILLTDYTAQRFYQVDINSGDIRGTFRPTGGSPAIAVDGKGSQLYWSDYMSRKIVSSSLNGSSVTTIKDTGLKVADGLAVDEVTGNIFFSAFDPAKIKQSIHYIAVVSPDGQSTKTLVSDLYIPRAVALHTAKGIMFFSDIGFGAHIGRVNMDGSDRQKIITTDIDSPNGIAIDFQDELLYWTDGGSRNEIERCSQYGSDRKVILTDRDAQVMCIVIDGDKLYYSAWNRRGITVANKADGSNKYLLMEYPHFAELTDFVIVKPGQHSAVENMCTVNNGGCSSFCLPTPRGRTCACADRVSLLADDLTCLGDTPAITSTQTVGNSSSSLDTPAITSTHTVRTPSSSLGTLETDRPTNEGNITITVVASITSTTIVVVAILIVITLLLIRKRRRVTTEDPVHYRAPQRQERDPYYLTPLHSDGYCVIDDNRVTSSVHNSAPSTYMASIARSSQASTYLTPVASDGYCAVDDNRVTSSVYSSAPPSYMARIASSQASTYLTPTASDGYCAVDDNRVTSSVYSSTSPTSMESITSSSQGSTYLTPQASNSTNPAV